jgi:prephenate dehydratase
VVYDDILRYKQSMVAIGPLTKELKILGEYEDAKSSL